ncbi:GAF and ANTAR domain-containing protein [Streptomyces sp. NPDC046909]|uniref:GAF and ANTAR domain-containing protein n=1 Tax=Streptomyces sp. NPDC046909 TaxID=3155617 RepID=UPI0033C34527
MSPAQPPAPGVGERALAGLQCLLLDSDRLEPFLGDLVRLAADLLPGSPHCSITLCRQGRPRPAAASDEMVTRFDDEQYDVGDGPCLEALRTGEPHLVRDIGDEHRFGTFPSRAEAHGLRSVLSLPLIPPGRPAIGVMNLYATEADGSLDQVRDQATVFAGYAAGALGVAQKIADRTRLSEDLQCALASRTVIDQALGIIMGQQRCSAEHAFQLLSRASQNRNRKLREVATDIITKVTGEPPGPPTPLTSRSPEH